MAKLLASLLVAVVALAMIGAGCGDSDDSGSADAANGSNTASAGGSDSSNADGSDGSDGSSPPVTTSSPTKAAFIKRASASCGRNTERILTGLGDFSAESKANRKLSNREFAEEVKVSVVAPSAETLADELRELGAPSGDEEEIEAILAAMQEGIDANKERRLAAIEEFPEAFTAYDELVKQYGLDACAFG